MKIIERIKRIAAVSLCLGLAATANAAITGIGTENNYFLLWFCRLFGKPQRYFFYGLPVYTD